MDAQARLRDVAVSDSGFVFDPYTGLTFSVNATGKLILDKLREGLAPDVIEHALAAAFDTVPGDDLGRDVREFILQLREAGLLPKNDAAASG